VLDWLRSRGETIPEADIIIAATAISKNLELDSRDEHFTRLLGYGLKLKEMD
jgi:predicted nucleic acid-binding protein